MDGVAVKVVLHPINSHLLFYRHPYYLVFFPLVVLAGIVLSRLFPLLKMKRMVSVLDVTYESATIG